MSNRSKQFLGSVFAACEQPLTERELDIAAEALLDYLGVTYAGAKKNEIRIQRMTPFIDAREDGMLAIGTGLRVSLKDAVFLNGLNAHAFDMDDGTNAGIIHLGSPVFSLLLPLAQRWDVSGKRLLESAVLGYETAFTLAVSVQPAHKLRGFHATGTCGCIGAAIAAAYLLGMSEEETWKVFGAACVAASGMLVALDGASELKPYNVAKASLLALTAVQMGAADFDCPDDPLFGDRGFVPTLCGRDICELEQPRKGGVLAIQKAYTKPYAACRYCHPAIEAAIKLVADGGIDPDAIASIDVATYDLAVRGHDHREVYGSASANMSIPYGVAVGCLTGKAGLAEYGEPCLSDGRVAALMRKVVVRADEGLSARFPTEQPAVVTIRLVSGEERACEIAYPKGEPENPMSREEKIAKFKEMLAYAGVEGQRADELRSAALDCARDERPLFKLL